MDTEKGSMRETEPLSEEEIAATAGRALIALAGINPDVAYIVVRYVNALRDQLAEQTRLAAEAQRDLAFMRDEYSPIGAKACRLCVHDSGKFIRSCRLHQELAEAQRERDEAIRCPEGDPFCWLCRLRERHPNDEEQPTGECLICGHDKPLGAWRARSNIGVCVECRDKARAYDWEHNGRLVVESANEDNKAMVVHLRSELSEARRKLSEMESDMRVIEVSRDAYAEENVALRRKLEEMTAEEQYRVGYQDRLVDKINDQDELLDALREENAALRRKLEECDPREAAAWSQGWAQGSEPVAALVEENAALRKRVEEIANLPHVTHNEYGEVGHDETVCGPCIASAERTAKEGE